MDELIKLPEWKAVLEQMIESGVKHGDVFQTEYFESGLRCKRDEMKFGIGVANIRRELEKFGMYLSGRGAKGTQYCILPAAANVDVMLSYQRHAYDALARGVILGTNTPLGMLSDDDRKKHESILERIAIKAVLLQRWSKVEKLVREREPELLQAAGRT